MSRCCTREMISAIRIYGSQRDTPFSWRAHYTGAVWLELLNLRDSRTSVTSRPSGTASIVPRCAPSYTAERAQLAPGALPERDSSLAG